MGILREKFDEIAAVSIPATASEIQKEDCEYYFMAGAAALHNLFYDEFSTNRPKGVLPKIQVELKHYSAAIEAREKERENHG